MSIQSKLARLVSICILGSSVEDKVPRETDSPLERTGFELAVPLRWTALRSEVVEEAFGSARYDERGRPQRPAVSACATP